MIYNYDYCDSPYDGRNCQVCDRLEIPNCTHTYLFKTKTYKHICRECIDNFEKEDVDWRLVL